MNTDKIAEFKKKHCNVCQYNDGCICKGAEHEIKRGFTTCDNIGRAMGWVDGRKAKQ